MKKRVFPLALVLALGLSLCANAAIAPRYNNSFSKTPKLTVYGAKAECGLTVRSNPGVKITASIDLQTKTASGSYANITGWYKTGTGTLDFSDTHTDSRISKGSTRMSYTVTVTGSNGTDTVSGYVYG